MRYRGGPATLILTLLSGSLFLISCHEDRKANNGPVSASIDLNAVTHRNQAKMFTEARQVGGLPKAVADYFGNRIADPGQPFNSTDIDDPRVPGASCWWRRFRNSIAL
jgi:hypothetical protein